MKSSNILQKSIVFYHYNHRNDDVGIGQNPADYLHYHDMYEINLVLSGQEQLSFTSGETVLQEQELCIFRPYEIHKRSLNPKIETRQICLAVKKECFEHAVYFLGNSIDTSTLFDITMPFIRKLHSSDMKIIYEHINSLYDQDTPSGQVANISDSELKIIIVELLAICLRKDPHKDFSIPMWLQQLVSDMDSIENAAEGIKALSRISGKSNSTISHAFKQYYNMTPSKFVNDKRLQNAAKLLLTSDNEIVDIAYGCGFGSLSYFYRQFNDMYGSSPSQFRKQKDYNKVNL